MSNEVSIVVRARDASGRVFDRANARAERLQGTLERLREKGMAPLATAALSLGPAIIPVLASATGGALALGTAFAGAGAALGVFAAVAKPVLMELQEQEKKVSDLSKSVDKYALAAKQAAKAGDSKGQAEALKKQTQAQAQLRLELALLSPAQRKAVMGYHDMRGAWEKFTEKNKPAIFAIFAKGFTILKKAIGSLQPLFDVGSRAVSEFLGKVASWQDSGGLKSMIEFLAKQASGGMSGLGSTFANIGSGLGKVFKVAGESSEGTIGSLERMSKAFANWAAGDSFSRFMDYAAENGPQVAEFLKSLAMNVATLVQVFTPFAPLSLAVASALSAILNAIPIPVLQTMVGLWVAYSLAVRAYSTAVLIASTYTKLLAGASKLLTLALSANPIGLVVVALGLLVTGLVIAYKKSATFRNVVREAFSSVGMAVLTAVQAMIGMARMWTSAYLSAIGLILDALAKVPGPTQDAAKKAADAFHGFQRGVDEVFGKVQVKLEGYKKTLREMPRAQLKAEVADLYSKVDAAKRKLSTVPASKRARVLADISQLQAAADRANAKLRGIKDRHVAVYVSEVNRDRATAGRKATGGVVGQAASGGIRGAWTMTGEEGPELVKLPPGSHVNTASRTKAKLRKAVKRRAETAFDRAIKRAAPKRKKTPAWLKREAVPNLAGAIGHAPSGGGGASLGDGGGFSSGGDYGGYGGEPIVIEIVSGGSRMDDLIIEIIRSSVRRRGGNVQIVLGNGSTA